MADTQVYEKNLGAKSANSIGTSDYVRVVGSDNNSYKQPMNDIGKTILEKYTGSTLAGSAQSAKSAIDTLNSNMIAIPVTAYYSASAQKDCDTLTERLALCSALAGLHYPENLNNWYVHSFAFNKKSDGTINNGYQIAVRYAQDARIEYYRRCGSGTWSSWEQLPSRAEVDALNSKFAQEIPSNGDLNNYTTSGFYWAGSNNTVSNTPGGYNGYITMIVLNKGTNLCNQIVIGNDQNVYYRTKFSSGWQAWKQLSMAYQSKGLSTVLSGSDITGNVMFYGNQVTIYAQIGGLSLSQGSNTIGTLSKYYPSTIEMSVCGFVGTGTVMGTAVRVTIDTSGVIKCYAPSSLSGTLRFTISYGTANIT